MVCDTSRTWFRMNCTVLATSSAARGAGVGQPAHLLRHDREAAAVLAGAGGLDRGVEGQQVGLGRDLLDQVDEVGDRLREPGQLLHLPGRGAHDLAHVEQRLARGGHVGPVARGQLLDPLAQLARLARTPVALASAIWRRLSSSASAFSIPCTCCSALAAILTMAVEISPLLAASSSLIAEKSLALLPI